MNFIVTILLVCQFLLTFSQVTIVSENFGNTSGLNIPVNSYTLYQNNNVLSFTGTASVRNTLQSTGYAGSSGLGNVFFNTNQQLTISNINTLCFANITLSLGIFKSTRLSNGSDFVIEYSTDKVTYIQLPYLLPTGDLTAIWRSIVLIDFLPSVENLTIRFRQTGTTTQFRIDDINISGIPLPIDTTKIVLRNCSSFTWDGTPYDVDSVYLFKRKTSDGCDSLISVDFIKDPFNTGCTLPIRLLSFSGECIQDKIQLEWITISELNNDRFEIEKFNAIQNTWNYIGTVYGSGTINRKMTYSFNDFQIENENIYRLKQFDYDGKFSYIDAIDVSCSKLADIIIYDLYGRQIQDAAVPGIYFMSDKNNTFVKKIFIK
jgi:hypothetical protein